VPATCPYPEPTPSNPHNPVPLPEGRKMYSKRKFSSITNAHLKRLPKEFLVEGKKKKERRRRRRRRRRLRRYFYVLSYKTKVEKIFRRSRTSMASTSQIQ
jgi:hypothetical protein